MERRNIDKCRILRKNQTDAERKLWSILRNRQLCGTKFRRQFPAGKYIIDFYSPKHKLAVEIDGGQHFENNKIRSDKQRTETLSNLGIKVLRFSNLEILCNGKGVCEIIWNNCKNI